MSIVYAYVEQRSVGSMLMQTHPHGDMIIAGEDAGEMWVHVRLPEVDIPHDILSDLGIRA